VKSTDYEAPRYPVSSTPFLLHPSWAQMSSTAPYSLCSTRGWNNIAEVNAANSPT